MNTRILYLSAAVLALVPALAQAAEGDSYFKQGDWVARGRMLAVLADESSNTSIGGEAELGDAVVPELDFSYFFTDHVAAELILAVAPHEVDASNTAIGNLDLGHVYLLPPTVNLQYHFTPSKQWKPYVGAGINYTVFFDEHAGSSINNIDYDNNFGYSLQAGVDYMLNEKWGVNFDVKKLFLNTDVSINNGGVTADVDIDPWIIGTGITYRF